MRPILITGFEPFGKSTLNPSGEIVKSLDSADVVTAILPVVFGQASSRLKELIELHKPSAVICLGQAEGRKEITPERIAINLDDARIADNAGVTVTATPIIENAPDGYFSTLPIQEIIAALKEREIPASISLTAGTFVCNHIFFHLQDYLKGVNVPSGFIHVPLMDEQSNEFPGLPTMPIATMVEAIEMVIALLKRGPQAS
jgi:pyroglutamyl-peptidase